MTELTNSPEPGSRGILYIATGRRHLEEMLVSVRSVRRHMPELPIVLHTDQSDLPEGLFDEVRHIASPRHSFIDKIAPLCETPFERTIFLDTDTLVCAPIPDLFDVLDRVDMAAAHAPFRSDAPFTTPNCFVELNTGVLAYRRTPEMVALFQDWLRLYEEDFARTGQLESDQHAFREALYRAKVSVYVLPPEYNLRTVMPAFVGRSRVRIIHGRGDMAALERWVGESRDIRLFLPSALQLTKRHFSILSGPGRIVAALIHGAVAPFVFAERFLRTWKRRLLSR
ncbi:MAG TPA: hypothetical protein VIM48_02315 [Chthoniobacterales bacterium]